MLSSDSSAGNGRSSTQMLLYFAILAGPLYVVVGLAQVLLRQGFDVRRHALSLLSNGSPGWIQIANFIVCGILVIAGAIGLRRALKGDRGGTWAPILLAVYGIGLIGAGIFIADPSAGFPPGTPMQTKGISTSGLLHFVFGGIGFYALIAASFVLARKFSALGQTGWVIYCLVTGIGFLVSFVAISSGSKSSAVILAFYTAVFWVWVWHTSLYAKIAGSR